MDLAAGLERDGPVAVKFQLVFPASPSFGRLSVRSSSIGSMKPALTREGMTRV